MTIPKKLIFTAAVIVIPVFIIGYNASQEKTVLTNTGNNNTNFNTNNANRSVTNASINRNTNTSSTNINSTNTNTTTVSTTTYSDGEYTASGSYQSPGGSESIAVTLTLSDNVVTAVTVVGNANNPTSKQYQSKFISGVEAAVVGKDISSLQLSKVSGSSLTPAGFNKALDAIKAEAEA